MDSKIQKHYHIKNLINLIQDVLLIQSLLLTKFKIFIVTSNWKSFNF